MKKYLLLLSVILVFSYSSAQTPQVSDSISAARLYKSADSLYRKGDFKKALKNFTICKAYYQVENKQADFLLAWLKSSSCYRDLGDLKKSVEINQQVSEKLDIVKDEKEKKKVAASLYVNMGINADRAFDYRNSIKYYLKSIQLTKEAEGSVHRFFATYYNNISVAYNRISIPDSALYYAKKSIDINEQLPTLDSFAISSSKHLIGIVYASMGLYDQAEKPMLEALELRKKVLSEIHPAVASSYKTLGAFYLERGQYHRAIEYSEKGILLLIKSDAPSGQQFTALFNIAESYKKLELYDQSLNYYDRALLNLRSQSRINLFYYRHLLLALATTQKSIGKFQLAKENVLKAKEVLESDVRYDSMGMASTLSYLGNILTEEGNPQQAIKPLLQSARIYESNRIPYHPGIPEVYAFLYEAYLRLDKPDSALYYLQKTLAANSSELADTADYEKNPAPGSSYRPKKTLNLMTRKTDLFNLLAWPDALKKNDKTFSEIDAIVEYNSQQMTSFSDQLALIDLAHESYSLAVDNAFKLYQESSDKQYFNRMLYFSDKNKSAILKKRLQNLGARKLLADSVFIIEQKVKDMIARSQSKINEFKRVGVDSLSDQMVNEQSQLFDLNRKNDSIKMALERNYPNYLNAKYQANTATVSELQKTLSTKDALVEYSLSIKQPIAMVITHDSFKAFQLSNLDSLSTLIDQMRSALTDKDRFSAENFRSTVESSHQMYKLLIDPFSEFLEGQQIKNVKIIPDQLLSFIPFEALIKTLPESGSVDYKSLDYLIKKYNISYQYAATVSLNNNGERLSDHKTQVFSGFAPSFQEGQIALPEQYITRGVIADLKWNTQEVETIQQILNVGNSFAGESASEANFKNGTINSRIIHLATHAFVDEENPLNSKILLTQENDTLQDGILHAFEIYNMQLNAELVTLSACNTGYGKLIGGEGTMSLARAFTYAGVRSVIMSHWEVNDKITGELMTNFYQNLAAGLPKDQALWQAKLQLIEESDPAISDPYYWAAFVLIGDSSAIDFNSGISWYWLLLLLPLAFIILLIVKRNKIA